MCEEQAILHFSDGKYIVIHVLKQNIFYEVNPNADVIWILI